MKKTIVIIMALLMVGSALAWNPNPTYNPFEVLWNAINGVDTTPDTIADDNIISAMEVDQNQIQLRVTGMCNAGSSIRAISQAGTVTCEPDDAGITSETDPQVGALTNGQWCRASGGTVVCDQSAPATAAHYHSTLAASDGYPSDAISVDEFGAITFSGYLRGPDGVVFLDSTGDLAMNNLEDSHFDGANYGALQLAANSGYNCNNICAAHGLVCSAGYIMAGASAGTSVGCSSTSGVRSCLCQ